MSKKYWKVNRYEFLEKNPYLGPWEKKEDAQAWADKASAVHSDRFTVIPTHEGWHVEQDVAQ